MRKLCDCWVNVIGKSFLSLSSSVTLSLSLILSLFVPFIIFILEFDETIQKGLFIIFFFLLPKLWTLFASVDNRKFEKEYFFIYFV